MSIILHCATFKFLETSGLHANTTKNTINIVGVIDHTKQEIIKDMGSILGTLPFRYLGVPLASKKLNVNAYLPLIKKITSRVTY